MFESTSIGLITSLVNANKDLIVIFKDEEPVLTNSVFNSFFGVASFEKYKAEFGPFVDNFVPHPSYFHKDKIEANMSWMDAISALEESDRIVSMLTSAYEPHAFSVALDRGTDGFTIVTFADITQNLIKRIMIENHANIDVKSGAYDKNYFKHVMVNYEDAARFNEKKIAIVSIELQSHQKIDSELLQTFVKNFKNSIREDDMLVRWSDERFLFVYLVDTEEQVHQVFNKLQSMQDKKIIEGLESSLSLVIQKEQESMKSLVARV